MIPPDDPHSAALPLTMAVQRSYQPITRQWHHDVFIKLSTAAVHTDFFQQVSKRDWKTLCVIALHMDVQGRCTPSRAQIARALGIDPLTASRRLHSLLHLRWHHHPLVQVQQEYRPDGGLLRNVYTVLPTAPLRFGPTPPQGGDRLDGSASNPIDSPQGLPSTPPSAAQDPPFTVEIAQEYTLGTAHPAWSQEVFIKLYTSALHSGFLQAISDEDWHTLCVIALHMNAQGHCYPTRDRLAHLLGINATTMSRRLHHLLAFTWQGHTLLQVQRSRASDGTLGAHHFTILPIVPLAFGPSKGDDALTPDRVPPASIEAPSMAPIPPMTETLPGPGSPPVTETPPGEPTPPVTQTLPGEIPPMTETPPGDITPPVTQTLPGPNAQSDAVLHQVAFASPPPVTKIHRGLASPLKIKIQKINKIQKIDRGTRARTREAMMTTPWDEDADSSLRDSTAGVSSSSPALSSDVGATVPSHSPTSTLWPLSHSTPDASVARTRTTSSWSPALSEDSDQREDAEPPSPTDSPIDEELAQWACVQYGRLVCTPLDYHTWNTAWHLVHADAEQFRTVIRDTMARYRPRFSGDRIHSARYFLPSFEAAAQALAAGRTASGETLPPSRATDASLSARNHAFLAAYRDRYAGLEAWIATAMDSTAASPESSGSGEGAARVGSVPPPLGQAERSVGP